MERIKILHKARFRLKDRGLSMKGWARVNGFTPTLVFMFFHAKTGTSGSPFTKSYDIEQALKRDGLWPSEEELAAMEAEEGA